MGAEDAAMRERLVDLRLQRDEPAQQISDLACRLNTVEPVMTRAKMEELALSTLPYSNALQRQDIFPHGWHFRIVPDDIRKPYQPHDRCRMAGLLSCLPTIAP